MYTIKQAAARSGVGISLLRAWERRYGVVHPVRTAGGYRLYDEDAIARLRAMRRLVDSGWSASQAAAAVIDETAYRAVAGVAPLTTEELTVPPDVRGLPPETAASVGAFVLAATRFDAAGLEDALDAMFAHGSVDMVLDVHLMPAVRALGDAWATGRLDIAEEHLASAAVMRRLGALYDLAGAPGAGPRVLVGLPPGGRHEIGPLAFAVVLRRRGIDVLYLGAEVPVESWVEAVVRSGAAAAVIGVQRVTDVARAREAATAIMTASPGLPVSFGGGAAGQAGIGLDVVELPERLTEAATQMARRLAPRD